MMLVEGLQKQQQCNGIESVVVKFGRPAHVRSLGYARQQGAHAQARKCVPALAHGPEAAGAAHKAAWPRTGAHSQQQGASPHPDQGEGRQACQHSHCMSEFEGSLLGDGKTCWDRPGSITADPGWQDSTSCWWWRWRPGTFDFEDSECSTGSWLDLTRGVSWTQCPAGSLLLRDKMTRQRWLNCLLGCRRAMSREAARACRLRRCSKACAYMAFSTSRPRLAMRCVARESEWRYLPLVHLLWSIVLGLVVVVIAEATCDTCVLREEAG